MSKSNTSMPPPRRAADELPDQAAVDAAGIALDVEMARLVACAIFRHAIRGRCKARMRLHNAMMGMAFMAHEPLDRNGTHEPAPLPELRLGRWPQGSQVFKRLGITNADLETYGVTARFYGEDAVLPFEWALAFYPAEIWPMIAKLIEWGPERTRLRLELAVMTMARTPTKRQRRRRDAGKPLSRSTIENYVDGVLSLTAAFVELRSIAAAGTVVPLAPFEAWTTTPSAIDVRELGARNANQDNSGPSIEACSIRLKQLAHEAERTINRDGYIKRRRVIFMATLPLFGPRDGALRVVNVDDYKPAHRYPDGSRGPVLVIHPGKNLDPDQPHFLPVPTELAHRYEAWIQFTGRHIGQPNEPMFPSRKPKPGQANTYMTAHGFYTAIAGARQAADTGSYALIPLDDDPYIGYRPHAYRHTAKQLIIKAATCLQRTDPGFYPHVHPDEFAKAVLGHELATTVSAVYRDLDPALLAKAVIDEAWRILWDGGVLRRGPDPDRIRAAREQHDALVITCNALQSRIHNCSAKAEQLINRADKTRDQTRKLTYQMEANSQQAMAARAERDLDRFQAQLASAKTELDDSQSGHVPIPNDRSAEEHALLVHAALHGTEPEPDGTANGPLADEITVSDVADLWATTEQTINRAYRNGQPASKPLMWLGGTTAWHVYHAKHKRLRTSAIHTAGLSHEQQELLTTLRSRRAASDAEMLHPALNVSSSQEPSKEQNMTHHQTIGRQTARHQLIDAWETSGSSPPRGAEANRDDIEEAS
jgi:hypothetical protein